MRVGHNISRILTAAACVLWYATTVLANKPTLEPHCLTLERVLSKSCSRDCAGTTLLDLYMTAWRDSLDATTWQPAETQLHDVEVIAVDHVNNGTGPQSDADVALIEYSCATASRIAADEKYAESARAVLSSAHACKFNCISFPTDRPHLTHSLEELKALAVEADCCIASLRRSIASINSQIICVRSALCNCHLRMRCDALACKLHALQHQLARCTSELNAKTDEVEKRVEELFHRFTRADTALAELYRMYPGTTSAAVVTAVQKYREGTGSTDKCMNAIDRHRRSFGNANSMLITLWRLHSEFRHLIQGTP